MWIRNFSNNIITFFSKKETNIMKTLLSEYCKDCKYWISKHMLEPGVSLGECRLNPPYPVDYINDKLIGQFVLSKSTDWCGKFEVK